MPDQPKVYIVAHVDWDTFDIVGIFSTREKAESILTETAKASARVAIREYTLDEKLGRSYGIRFWSTVDSLGGSVVGEHSTYELPTFLDGADEEKSEATDYGTLRGSRFVDGYGESTVSAKRSVELARAALAERLAKATGEGRTA